jgi:hypothetical protein
VLMAATRAARPTATSSLMNVIVDEDARMRSVVKQRWMGRKKGGW